MLSFTAALNKLNFLYTLSVAYLPCIFISLQSRKREPKL